MFKKNTAVVGFGIGHFINASTGAAVTTGMPTCKRTLDGTGGACANAAAYNTNGAAWKIDLAAGDLNADMVILSFTLTDCLPISYTIKTVTGVPDGDGLYLTSKTGYALTSDYDAAKTAASQTSVNTIDALLDKIAPLLIGNVTGAGTGTEVYVYAGVTVTIEVTNAGNVTSVVFT